ncbi:MAG: hypothetical protein CDV28_16412 [Candidatus Electronema aureum]|uniref:Uncharacterized protein n=1 Tax=Candidatus Electronema aureum TaxID=2005002 RepID=A0A521FYA9_9BACT|nr:MAG: hypothetical protein CDV28_16412 [Candidatus Electronema aureum]
MKSEKPRRKGQGVVEFRQILGGIYYTAGKRTDHQKMKREEREEDAVSGKVEEAPGV